MRHKIICITPGKLSKKKCLKLARLLIKAGYVARVGQQKPDAKNAMCEYFIEYWEDRQDE